jgi:hypothetical protein
MAETRVALVSMHVRPGPEAVPLAAAGLAAAWLADPDLAGRLAIDLVDSFVDADPAAVAAAVLASRPRWAGFSVYSWNRARLEDVAARLRSLDPALVLFAGGPDISARRETGPFDFVVIGEGEASGAAALAALVSGRSPAGLPGILAAAAAPGGDAAAPGIDPAAAASPSSFLPAPALDPANLPSPWLSGILKPDGREGVLWELTRGCPYACAYCYEAKGERRVRRLADDRIEAELALFAAAGVPSVFVLDPTFNADRERARRLLTKIAAVAPDCHWHFEVRAEGLDRDLAGRFAALGASLQIGLQTADPAVAARIGRSLAPGKFAAKIGLLNEAGAVFGLDLIYGLPGDSLAGYRASLDFALGLYPNNLDMFRLAVLPGTPLADTAAADGLVADAEPPYLVRSAPTWTPGDLAAADRLSRAVDLFYNRGRAVAWFNQVLHPLGAKPSRFAIGFAEFLDRQPHAAVVPPAPGRPADPVWLERLQLAYLDERFADKKLDFLLPAVWDVVRFHGAWSRALAEGIATDIDFAYDPDELLGPSAMDLEEFVALAEPKPGRYRVLPGEGEPELVRLGGRRA